MKNRTYKKIADHVEKKIIEGDEQTIQGVIEEENIDHDTLQQAAKRIHKKAHFKIKSIQNRLINEDLLERASLLIQEGIEANLDRPVSFMKKLVEENEFEIHYRNLDKLTLEEIKSIIRDQNLLKILEELSRDDQ